jgi:hypothetical protein
VRPECCTPGTSAPQLFVFHNGRRFEARGPGQLAWKVIRARTVFFSRLEVKNWTWGTVDDEFRKQLKIVKIWNFLGNKKFLVSKKSVT